MICLKAKKYIQNNSFWDIRHRAMKTCVPERWQTNKVNRMMAQLIAWCEYLSNGVGSRNIDRARKISWWRRQTWESGQQGNLSLQGRVQKPLQTGGFVESGLQASIWDWPNHACEETTWGQEDYSWKDTGPEKGSCAPKPEWKAL